MIAVIDYGLGNLRSVVAAVKKVGFTPCITYRPSELKKAEKLILPGVGAFGDGMKNLHQRGLTELLNDLVLEKKKPILCICLGFQLLANESQEFGLHAGLGWIDGSVIRLVPREPDIRIPHVGWNDLEQVKDCLLFEDIPAESLFYYVHSYHCLCNDSSLVFGECVYGQRFTSVICRDNIYATQFHPEKSQYYGLKMLHNFLSKA